MDLSIIIVNWNSKEYLRNCIRSIKETVRGISYEIIVTDNNSTDSDFTEVEKLYSSLILIKNQANIGFSRANNQGAEIARGRYLLFLNPDTIVKENSINLLFECIKKNGYGAVAPKLLSENGNIQMMCARKFPSLAGTFYNMFLLERVFPESRIFGKNLMGNWDHLDSREVNSLCGACVMVEKEIFTKIGGFDPDYIFYGEDVDLCFRIYKAGKKIFYCYKAEIIHYGKGSTKVSSKKKVFYEIILFCSEKLYFKKNTGIITFLIFNLICFFASIFRLILILSVGPFFRFSPASDYNWFNFYKYLQILLISSGITSSKRYKSIFEQTVKNRKKRKNILFVPGFSAHSYCIVEQIFIKLAEQLSKKYNVYWFVSNPGSKYVRYINKDCIKLLYGDEKSNLLKQFLLFVKIIKKYEINLIYTHFSFERFLVTFAGKLLGRINLWHEHWLSLAGKYSFLKKIYYKYCIDHIISNCNFVKKCLRKEGIAENKISIIYYTYDINQNYENMSQKKQQRLKGELSIENGNIVIGMVAAFRKEKYYEDLIQIFARLAKDNEKLILLLIGGPGIKGNNVELKIKVMVDSFCLKQRVLFSGYRDDVIDLYDIMDIFAFTSVNEPWGNVVVEAMAKGLPVVAYNSGGYAELIEDGVHGYLVDKHDINKFANVVQRLLNSMSLRKQIGNNARKKILDSKELTMGHFIQANLNVIDDLLKKE